MDGEKVRNEEDVVYDLGCLCWTTIASLGYNKNRMNGWITSGKEGLWPRSALLFQG